MSSYDCVLPINFDRFTNLLIPAWMRVLSGENTLSAFVSAFIPHGSECFTEDFGYSSWDLRCPGDYLELFAGSDATVWKTEQIVGTEAFRNWNEQFGHEEVLCAAIKQFCAFELLGADSLADLMFNGYYNRLHEFPYVQVAGTKSQYRFLHNLYTAEWKELQGLYKFHRLQSTTSGMLELLELLFLGVRALPGSRLLSEVPAWPASDDLWIQGYLAPEEVAELGKFIDQMQTAAQKQEDNLFPLFSDRLKRAAEAGAGLITIHGGL